MGAHKKPLTLSIVIPAYNEENYLKNCLDAIAAQKVRPNEVIVVDNNSDDKTAEVAATFSFVTLLSETKEGIVYARNKGFNAAKSDIIGRIDVDTVLPSDWVDYVLNFYSGDNLDKAWTGRSRYYNVPGSILDYLQHLLIFSFNRRLLGHDMLWGSNMAIPRNLWQKVGADVCLRNDIHEDLDLSLHLHKKGFEIIYDPKEVVSTSLRLIGSPRQNLWANLKRWPKTLKVHKIKVWWVPWFVVIPTYLTAPFINLVASFNKAPSGF